MNIFNHVGKLAITARKLQRVACNKLHLKPRSNGIARRSPCSDGCMCDNRARQLYKNLSMLFLFPVKDGKLSTGVNATFDASCYS